MKIKLILGCCVVFILFACSEDDFSEVLSEDRNWFVLQDNPGDELQHLAYEVYKDTGIPVFYNDTIGREERGMDVYGNPVIYCEILAPTYALTSANTSTLYTLSTRRENIKLGIELLRDEVIPKLPAMIHVHSFLLVDSLRHDESGYGESGYGFAWLDAYVGLMTTVVGRMESIADMLPKQKKGLATKVVSQLISAYLVKSSTVSLTEFYAVSNKYVDPPAYDQWIYGKTKEACGFLSSPEESDPDMPWGYFKSPTQEQDLSDYLFACLNMEEAEFKDCYGMFEPVMEKYEWIKKRMEELKVKS